MDDLELIANEFPTEEELAETYRELVENLRRLENRKLSERLVRLSRTKFELWRRHALALEGFRSAD